MDKSHKQLDTDAAINKAETFIGNKLEKKKSVVGVEGFGGANNRIWYKRKETRKVKTEGHEAQLTAS